MGHEIFVDGRVVTIPRNPNPVLNSLTEEVRSIWNESSTLFCSSVEVNFIGALLTLKHQQQIKDLFKNGQYPESLITPIEVKDDITIAYYSDFRSPGNNVLVNRSCGSLPTGLVLKGDLAGILVYKSIRTNGEIHPARIFVDKPIPDDPMMHPPYPPRPVIKNEEFFKNLYLDLIKEVQAYKGKQIYLTDLLFYLCKQLNIDIDFNNFFYTINRNFRPSKHPFYSSPENKTNQ